MSDSSNYTEFKLCVTVYSLESEDEGPCTELAEICRLIRSSPLSVSPVELYPQTHPLTLTSTDDAGEFLSIDLQAEPTDQMEVVTVFVRCKSAMAEAVRERLDRIHSRSGVQTALLQGNLGLVSQDTNPYESPGVAANQYACPICGKARGELLSKCPNCGWMPDQLSSNPKPQMLSKSIAILLGLATALPLAYVCFFMVLILLMALGGGEFSDGAAVLLVVVHLAVMVLILCLIGIYIGYLFKTEYVPADKKALWAVVLFLGNLLAMPIFWYIYVWKPIEQDGTDRATGLRH